MAETALNLRGLRENWEHANGAERPGSGRYPGVEVARARSDAVRDLLLDELEQVSVGADKGYPSNQAR